MHRGGRHIRGGRATVRTALYMATLVATKHDPVIRDYYQHLKSNGKPKKVALVACMRKRLNYLTSLLKTRTRQRIKPRRRSEMRRGPGQSPGCLIAKKVLIFKTVAFLRASSPGPRCDFLPPAA